MKSEIIKENLINTLINGNSLPKDIDLDGNVITTEFSWENPVVQSMHAAAADIVSLIFDGLTPQIPQGKNGKLVFDAAVEFAEASKHLYRALMSADKT